MKLAVNIGNTNIRVAAGDSGKPVSDVVCFAEGLSASEHFAKLLERHFTAAIWKEIDGSIVSSVVPAQTPIVVAAIRNKTGVEPQRVDINKCSTLSTRSYSGVLGEDRVICCAGALQKYAPPLILIDFGTATTINVVSGDKEFLGGAILTGLQIGLDALAGHTALLPQIVPQGECPVIGTNTQESLLSGAVIGLACAAGGFIRRIERKLGCEMPVIVTGGHAPVLLPHCDFPYIHEPNILFDGLFSI